MKKYFTPSALLIAMGNELLNGLDNFKAFCQRKMAALRETPIIRQFSGRSGSKKLENQEELFI